jgi:hypothetical protein
LVLYIGGKKMMKQVEIGKKGFLNLLNPIKITIRGLWRLGKTLEMQTK